MPFGHPWHLYPGRHWPLSESEELAFHAELERLGGRSRGSGFTRGDITALLNALRCGITPAALLACSPGLKAAQVAAAWRDINKRLTKAREAWAAICAEPTWHVLADQGGAANLILPIPVRRLMVSARTLGPRELEELVCEMASECAAIEDESLMLEHQLESLTEPSQYGVKIGRILYNPYEPSLWGHPYYLPTRPGTLMPVKVADLLDERRR